MNTPHHATQEQTRLSGVGVASKIQILGAAIAQFSKSGYYGASTREIAKMAGVNEVTLFRIFSNKRSLYLRALETAMRNVTPATDPRSPEAKTVGGIENACGLLRENLESCRLIYFGLLDNSKDVEQSLRKHMEEYVRAVECSFGHEASNGAIKCRSLRAFAGALLAIAINDQPLTRIFLPEIAVSGDSLLEHTCARCLTQKVALSQRPDIT